MGLVGLEEVKESTKKTIDHSEPRQLSTRSDEQVPAEEALSDNGVNEKSYRSRVISPIPGPHSAEKKEMNPRGRRPKRAARHSQRPTSRREHGADDYDPDFADDEDAAPVELKLPGEPLIVARDQHSVSRKHIDPDCLKVMRRLNRHGFMAFLVGGGVRDLLLGRTPKDYDVGTDATPEEIRTLFRNSRTIGRRFKLNHVYFRGNKIIEVSTFRDSAPEKSEDEEIQTLAPDNVFGNPQTDAIRRDLTINGLFYDMQSFSVIDYVGGIEDLNNRVIRTIGDPFVRFQEDPVRMIRAVRHAARTGFKIEKQTYQAISELSELITVASTARVYEELMRELRGGFSQASLTLLDETGLLKYLLPFLAEAIAEDRPGVWERLGRTLAVIDAESSSKKEEVSAAVIFAALIIGNVPAVKTESMAADEKHAGLLDYWEVSPRSLQDDGRQPGLAPESEEEEPKPASRRFRRSAAKSKLAKSISDLIGTVSVSRKDRERMEQLLAARLMMVTREDEAVYPALSAKPYFADALLLLRATAHDQVSQSALERWENREIKKGASKSSSGSRRRSRRGRPRRSTR